MQAGDVDGLLINGNQSAEMVPTLQFSLGLTDLTLVNVMSAFGSTAGTMLQYAAHAIATGQASVVACLYADAPLREGGSISQSGYSGRRFDAPGLAGLRFAYGDYGPANSGYAMALRRHMHLFGTTHEQLGTIAVGQRAWAATEPARADAQADDASTTTTPPAGSWSRCTSSTAAWSPTAASP